MISCQLSSECNFCIIIPLASTHSGQAKLDKWRWCSSLQPRLFFDALNWVRLAFAEMKLFPGPAPPPRRQWPPCSELWLRPPLLAPRRLAVCLFSRGAVFLCIGQQGGAGAGGDRGGLYEYQVKCSAVLAICHNTAPSWQGFAGILISLYKS